MQTEKMKSSFKVGQEVKWASVANGSKKTKKGTIVAVVPPGKVPAKPRAAKDALVSFAQKPRKTASYLVLAGKKLYRPHVQHLKPN